MPIHERKQSGCWTCRIRKKKCDEAYPSCSSCVVRGITCYGYGAKPEWMDGGEKQKEITEELKRVVKENIKQERGNRISRTTPNTTPLQNEQITPPYSSASPPSPEPLPTRGTPANFPLDPYSIQYDYPACLPNPAAVIEHMEGRDVRTFEITLLMNYLDHVFPLQFSCYTPPVTELGRGWLLALLTRTKPLYHAALALSAFHMHSMLLKTNRHTCINGHWEVMRHNHEKAFTELQVQIHELQQEETRSLKGTIETVACIIQLISSEVSRLQCPAQCNLTVIPSYSVAEKVPGESTSLPQHLSSQLSSPTYSGRRHPPHLALALDSETILLAQMALTPQQTSMMSHASSSLASSSGSTSSPPPRHTYPQPYPPRTPTSQATTSTSPKSWAVRTGP